MFNYRQFREMVVGDKQNWLERRPGEAHTEVSIRPFLDTDLYTSVQHFSESPEISANLLVAYELPLSGRR